MVGCAMLALIAWSMWHIHQLNTRIGRAQADLDVARQRAAIAEQATQSARESLYPLYVEAAEHSWHANDVHQLRDLLETSRNVCGKDWCGFEWYFLWLQSRQNFGATTLEPVEP